jgi:hypothetical protein
MAFFGSCSTKGHHQAGLGVLTQKLPAGAVLEFALTPKSRFCHGELLWL